jgi:hypothetical protein
VARFQEDYGAAAALLEESLTLARVLGDSTIVATNLHHLGMLRADWREDYVAARPALEESLALYRALGIPRFVALLCLSLAEVTRAEGLRDDALVLLREGLTTMVAVGEQLEVHWALDACAHLAFDAGQAERAVRLAGAAAGLRERLGTRSTPVVQRERTRWLIPAQAALGDAAFAMAWTAGEVLTREQAITDALDWAGASAAPASSASASSTA